jgi:hypothetical protein
MYTKSALGSPLVLPRSTHSLVNVQSLGLSSPKRLPFLTQIKNKVKPSLPRKVPKLFVGPYVRQLIKSWRVVGRLGWSATVYVCVTVYTADLIHPYGE